MKSYGLKSVIAWIMTVIAFGMMGGPLQGIAQAEDPKAMLKELDQELRQAQRDMFSGKTDKAIDALDRIKEKLIKVKAADPNNPRVKTAENKYTKLVKDLERRTGKDLGGGTLTTASSSTQPVLPSKPEPTPAPAEKAAPPDAVEQAGTEKSPAKEAGDLLRQAEKSMHAGKNEEAKESLDQASVLIEKMKEQNPDNPQAVSLGKKHDKIRKMLETKMAKAEPTPAKVSAPTAAGKAAPAAVKIPNEARRPLGNVKMRLQSLDRHLSRLADPDYRGNKEQLVENIDAGLADAKEELDKARSLAAKKGVTSHPDFDKAEAELAAAEKRAAEAKGSYGERKAAAAARSEEVDADVEALREVYEEVRPVFDRAMGTVIHYNDLKTAEALIEQIEGFEKNKLAAVKEKTEAFAAKYGSTSGEIDKKADSMGYSGQGRASFPYTALVEGVENVKKTRVVMADDLIRRAGDKKASARLSDFSRSRNHKAVRDWAELAARFDADNPRVREFMAGFDAWIEEDMKSLNAKIDKASWPSRASNAPEDYEKLTKAAFEFLQGESDKLAAKDKDGRKMLGVVITGPWTVFKVNLLKEPIQYGLPVVGAVQLDSEKAMNVARVYALTLLTQEFKGVAKAPPFIGSAVGNSYYIRPSAVEP